MEAFFSFRVDFFCFGRKLRSQKHKCKICNAGRKWLSSQIQPQLPGRSVMVLLMGSGLFFPWIVPFRELEKFLSEHRLGGTAVRPSAGTALESWAFGVSLAREVRHKPYALIH